LQFDAATYATATGYIEIYGTPPAATPLTATLELAAAANAPPLVSSEANILMSADPDRRVVTGDLAIATVAPGDYILRAVVKLDGRAIGQAVRTIRIVRPGS
jgi:hypothetical protein